MIKGLCHRLFNRWTTLDHHILASLIHSQILGNQKIYWNFRNKWFLPSIDGNSPIGKDQSGNGNDFTPVNFGGSVELDSPLYLVQDPF